MRKIYVLFVAILCVACLSQQVRTAYPEKGMTYNVELTRIQIGDSDFNLSTFGNPLTIEVKLKKDGNVIASNRDLGVFLSGDPGERILENPPRWRLNYSSNSNYQIVLEEQSIIADASSYELPRTPKLGVWPFPEKSITIRFGSNSYLHFEVSELE